MHHYPFTEIPTVYCYNSLLVSLSFPFSLFFPYISKATGLGKQGVCIRACLHFTAALKVMCTRDSWLLPQINPRIQIRELTVPGVDEDQ
jgi:hypothetical protein